METLQKKSYRYTMRTWEILRGNLIQISNRMRCSIKDIEYLPLFISHDFEVSKTLMKFDAIMMDDKCLCLYYDTAYNLLL